MSGGILGGVSNVLFGGGGKSAAEPYRQQAQGVMNGMGPMRNTYYGLGQQAYQRYQSASPQYQQSVNDLGSMLRQRMGQQGRTAIAQRIMGNGTSAYNGARARVLSGLSGRGMDGFTAGMMSNLEGQYSGQMANALNSAGEAADARDMEYAQQLAALYQGQTDQAQRDMYQGYGAASDIDRYRISTLSGMGQEAEQERQARESYGVNQMLGLVGAGANLYGGYLAGRRNTNGGNEALKNKIKLG